MEGNEKAIRAPRTKKDGTEYRSVTFALPMDVYKIISAEAIAQRRSLSQQILFYVDKGMAQ